ncbi:hypothetical protein ABIC84_000290 [Mucilaginibacter sp. 3215]
MPGGPAMPAPIRPLFTLLIVFSGANRGRFVLKKMLLKFSITLPLVYENLQSRIACQRANYN